jgi:hypothetical protein
VAKSVLRTGPCLLGLFSLICLIFAEHCRHHRIHLRVAGWYGKTQPTFSDAIATVRRLLWSETLFCRVGSQQWSHKTPASVEGHPAGLPQPGGVTWSKTAKVELRDQVADAP